MYVRKLSVKEREYSRLVKKASPPSPLFKDMARAFLVGGIICCIGQALIGLWGSVGLSEENASAAASVTLVFLGALFTALGVYDRIAKFAGAGTLVPITGFANSIVSPAMEFRFEGLVSGMAAKMFVIAGPVLVFGVSASVVYGILFYALGG